MQEFLLNGTAPRDLLARWTQLYDRVLIKTEDPPFRLGHIIIADQGKRLGRVGLSPAIEPDSFKFELREAIRMVRKAESPVLANLFRDKNAQYVDMQMAIRFHAGALIVAFRRLNGSEIPAIVSLLAREQVEERRTAAFRAVSALWRKAGQLDDDWKTAEKLRRELNGLATVLGFEMPSFFLQKPRFMPLEEIWPESPVAEDISLKENVP